jgi:hypothetical protein
MKKLFGLPILFNLGRRARAAVELERLIAATLVVVRMVSDRCQFAVGTAICSLSVFV